MKGETLVRGTDSSQEHALVYSGVIITLGRMTEEETLVRTLRMNTLLHSGVIITLARITKWKGQTIRVDYE